MKDVIYKLNNNNETISIMESCTGGYISSLITDIEGASNVFSFSAVTYSNLFKEKMGVSYDIIEKYSVYSIEASNEMSFNISKYSDSTYGVGITGLLNSYDRNNQTKYNNLVYISIYNKNKDVYYNKIIKLNKFSRKKNKKIISLVLRDMLLNIIN